MKTAVTTDWNLLLSSKGSVNLMRNFSIGKKTCADVSKRLSNTEKAGEFRKLIRANGVTYARRLTRKALNYRGLLKIQKNPMAGGCK